MHVGLVFLLGVLSTVLGLTALVTGRTLNRRFDFIDRQHQPAAFWAHVLVHLVAGLGIILYALASR